MKINEITIFSFWDYVSEVKTEEIEREFFFFFFLFINSKIDKQLNLLNGGIFHYIMFVYIGIMFKRLCETVSKCVNMCLNSAHVSLTVNSFFLGVQQKVPADSWSLN